MSSINPSEQPSSSSQSSISQPLAHLFDLLWELGVVKTDEQITPIAPVDNSPEEKVITIDQEQDLPNYSRTEMAFEVKNGSNELDFSQKEETKTIIPINESFNFEKSQNFSDAKYPDIDVEIDTEIKSKLTLLQAVEYEAFLRQKIDSDSNSTKLAIDSSQSHQIKTYPVINQNQSSSKPEELIELEETLSQDEIQVENLADSLNNLIPLIVELLNNKIYNSRESILEAVTPVIDRIIEQRSAEDRIKMATALAKILPHAITEEIQLSPQAIAKAIAPEIALAIEEQILLDRNAISNALGSEMGKAIKTQIELEKDAMVDALYPVIGNTISKYMVEVIQSINTQVENALSVEGIRRKIRAKVQGVSEAELILQEAIQYHVQAVFLIDKDSGIVIQEVQFDQEHYLESDMIAGMLTAIRSFANDCIASGSELDEIDYGDWQIPIEVAGYCYLAAIIKGEPSKQFRQQIRHTLSEIVLKYGDAIKDYEGDSASVPQGIQLLLQDLIASKDRKTKSSSTPTTLIWLLVIVLSIIFIPWGIIHYRGKVADKIAQETAVQLDAAPELSVYRLDPQVNKEKLTLTGRVPSQYLRNQAAEVGQKIAQRYNLQLDNQIIAINIPAEPGATASEVKRLTNLFNQNSQIAIKTNYQPQTVTIEGFVLQEGDIETIRGAFKQIPGVDTVILTLERQLPNLDTRIYFDSGSSQLNLVTDSSKIRAIKQFLDRYPQLHWQLIGHSDRQGASSKNRQLGLERAKNVRAALVAQGVNISQLKVSYSDELPPGVGNSALLSLSRCVRFEPFISAKSSI